MSKSAALPTLDRSGFSRFLEYIADSLDIPSKLFDDAVSRYEEVGAWLAQDEGGVGQYSPEIYPQGSFKLGTAVLPINESCEYDIDLVCRLEIKKESTTQKDLRDIIGKRLKENPEFEKALSSSRRCWNLNFPKQFHLDVLPAIPNLEKVPHGILLTDTDLSRWQKSNPKVYSEWFYDRMAEVFQRRREELAKAFSANVEDVPEWRVRTPLQRAVQILKRHRDIAFKGEPQNRPVSIIITTLAARAYSSEETIADALDAIVTRIPQCIENRNGVWWVPNPVEPDENFADKWNEKPIRRVVFFSWLKKLQGDLQAALQGKSLTKVVEILGAGLGERVVLDAETRFLDESKPSPSVIIAPQVTPLPTIKTQIGHCQSPKWPISLKYKVDIRGSQHLQQNGRKFAELARRPVRKGRWLRFVAQTNTPTPYSVEWQVVNTGLEAAEVGQLRGDFYGSQSPNVRWERTQYTGLHWVEAFVIKDGVCVARSDRFYVNIG